MEVFDRYDVKVADGYMLRYLVRHRLNEYVNQLNSLYLRLSNWDFSREEIYVYYEYRKIFYKKVEAFRKLLRLLNEFGLVSDRVLRRAEKELNEMMFRV